MVNSLLIIFCLIALAVFIVGLFFPTDSNLYQEEFKNKVTKTTFKSNRLKVVNKYHYGLFKKVVFVDKGNVEKRFYINNYFKRKFILIVTFKNF